MKVSRILLAATIVATPLYPHDVRGEDSPETIQALKVRGYLQADSRLFADDYPGGAANDTFLIRRPGAGAHPRCVRSSPRLGH